MALSKFFAIFCLILANGYIKADVPCPFNDECTCDDTDPSAPFTYSYVSCEFHDTVKELVPAQGSKYTITQFEILLRPNDTTKFYEIPANYFKAFDTINSLSLYMSCEYLDQKFDDNAFAGVQINQLHTVRITDIIPPPDALKQLGESGLQILDISTSQNIRFGKNDFKKFSKLTSLQVHELGGDLYVDAIDNDAFNGLERSLSNLQIEGTTFSDFPAKALEDLKHLQTLEFEAGAFTKIQHHAFSPLEKLKVLSLSNLGSYGKPYDGTTNLTKADAAGDLDSLSDHLMSVSFDYTGLTDVPKRFKKLPQLQVLSLIGNFISSLKKDSFDDKGSLTTLTLDYNPIKKIEASALPTLQVGGTYSFSYTSLTSVDFSIFDYPHQENASEITLYFDGIKTLKTLAVHDTKKIKSYTKLKVSVQSTALETVDTSIGMLLSSRPYVIVSIKANTNLLCQNVDWMANYAFCTKQLLIDSARCADKNGQLLSDYLKEHVTYSC